jgi:ligand-binding sensor domain-containing protein/DNA-binding CsgD family transcriptional regulator
MNRIRGFVFVILCTIAGPLCGQQDAPYSALKFQKITQKNELSHNNIECIFKDSDGFMWFGTRNGLCRYDGYEIKVYRSSDGGNSLSGDRILALEEDRQGNLWIGTYGNGLNKYNKKTGQFTHYGDKKFLSTRINRIKILRDGSLWICSNYGLAMYVPEQDSFNVYLSRTGDPQSLNSSYMNDIVETAKGEVYVATEADAIQRLDRRTGIFTSIPYRRDPGLSNNYRKRIVEDRQGVLWISANVHGLCSYDPATGESALYMKGPGKLSTDVLNGDMALDPEGNLWVCTDGGGINVLDGKTGIFSYIRSTAGCEDCLGSDHIYTVYFDDHNTVWIGTFNEGINYHDPERFKFGAYYSTPDDLGVFKNRSVLSIYQDKKKRLWVGTDGEGLYMFDGKGRMKRYLHQPGNANSISTNVITSISEDFSGNILIGTYSGGLVSLNPERNVFTRFNQTGKSTGPISSLNVWDILPDSKGRIWLGLLGTGVDRYDPATRTFTNYGPGSSRSDRITFQNVMALMEDADGNIWFGTEGKGIFILDDETSKIVRLAADSSKHVCTQGVIKCLYQDHLGFIWVGTEGDGLYRFDRITGEWLHYSEKNGLPGNIVQSILEDRQGNLWFGTSNGLGFFNVHTRVFKKFVEEDGLSGNEFNADALVRLADGRFLAGTSRGADIFRPEEIRLNQNLPQVKITRLDVLNREVLPGQVIRNRAILTRNIAYTQDVTLTFRDKTFSLEFAALNYTLPEKCRYVYKLDGFDDAWNYTSSDRRQVSYSNLLPGEYVFRVRASNNDGKWGNNESSLRIRVLPPWYHTWWFRMLMVLVLLSVVYFIYAYRLNIHKDHFRQKQMEQERRIMHLEKEKLESELQKMTFHILNRNRALIDQKNRLLGLSVKAREVVRTGLLDIIGKIDEELTDDKDWTYIEPQLDKVYNNFVTRLKEKHPDLTLSEIKIAAYVRMNLSTKEISEFMHKTGRAVENDRYRLRKKIGLDSNDSLQHYLVNL